MAQWNEALGFTVFTYEGDCPEEEPGPVPEDLICYGYEDGVCPDDWIRNRNGRNEIIRPDPDIAPAGIAHVRYRGWDPWEGVAYQVDIDISRRVLSSPGCTVSLLAHELGHGLGFDHSVNRESVMYPTYSTSGDCSHERVREWEAQLLLDYWGIE